MLYLIGFLIVLYLIVKWSMKNFDFFEKQGIKFVKPYPLLGTNTWLMGRENVALVIKRLYDKFRSEKLFGLFSFHEPLYVIRDPALLKQLAVKDFENFTNRVPSLHESYDEMFGNVLSFMRDKKWKEMRGALSPIFTGSKMRVMFDLVAEVVDQMSDYIEKESSANKSTAYDIKDIFSRFTNDVIATCAFGVKCDSFENPKNELFEFGKTVTSADPLQMIKILFIRYFPRTSRYIGLKFFPKNTKTLFETMTIETMVAREKSKIYRPDLINLLMQVRKGKLQEEDKDSEKEYDSIAAVNEDIRYTGKNVAKKTWTDNEIIAQCFVFFFAGFEPTSSMLRFLSYELATNPDVQDKLVMEIDELHQSLDGQALNYDKLQSLKYLDMVISEVLRKWPTVFMADRQCSRDFTYNDNNGLRFTMKKGMAFWIPIFAFHRDAKYFPNPETFDPERFSEENRSSLNMDAYLPFGIGPRNCIGSRFALMEMKIAIYHMVRKFKFEVSPETQVPMKLKKTPNGLLPEVDVKLYLKLRKYL